MVCSACGRSLRPSARFCGACGQPVLLADLLISPDRPASSTILSTQPLLPGTTLGPQGRYRIDRMLGKGGFGETYRALDTQLMRFCVVKRAVISPTLDAAEQQQLLTSFAHEARLLVTLNEPGHDNIPEIYEYLPEERCLVMKYIEGRSLEDVLNLRVDGLPEEIALRYARAVCSALVYMHGRSSGPLLHRDIKPANILLGNDDRLWLIDFGLAKTALVSHSHPYSRDTLIAGTPGYAPPEQWRGTTDARSDVYALAATLHQLLTNYQFSSEEQLVLMQGGEVARRPVRQLNPPVHPDVERLITRALASEAAARPTAQEFLAELDTLVAQPHIPPPPEPARPPLIAGFIGREAELATFQTQLSSAHLAIITGLAGVGKTTLAGALASQVADGANVFWHTFHQDESIDGVIWELAGFLAWHGQDELWRLLNSANGSGGQAPPFEVLLDYLLQTVRGQNYLLCFDDAQFIDDDPLFERLLTGLHQIWHADGGALIITSRHVPAFVRLGDIAALRGLSAADTRHLLANRGVTLSGSLAEELHQRTEGNAQFLTLAIDALLRATDPARLIARLSETNDIERYLLREVDRGLSDEQRSVMGVVAALLGYGGTRHAIEALLDAGSLRRLLHDLSQRHLLTVSEGAVDREYGQHAMVQAFYYDSLSKRDRQSLHRRAGAYYETEEPDTLKAARHYLAASEFERAATLATTDIWAQINRGQARGLNVLLEQLPDEQLKTEQQAVINIARGEMSELLGRNDLARANYQRALGALISLEPISDVSDLQARVYRGIGESLRYTAPQEALGWLQRGLSELSHASVTEQAVLYVRIGTVLTSTGNYTAATDAFEQGLHLLPEDADDWRANALSNLGVIYCSQGNAERGTVCYRDALAIYERSGNIWKMITIWQNLGIEMEIAGDWPGALEQYRQALEQANRLGSVTRQTELEQNLGDLLVKQGDIETAMMHLSQGIDLARTHDLKEHLVCIQVCMADVWIRLEEWDEATQALQEAQALTQELQSQDQLPEIYRHWAHVYVAQRTPQRALEQIEHALHWSRKLELDLETGKNLRVLAQIVIAEGQLDQALAAFEESLLLVVRDPYEAARTKAAWGQALLDGTEAERGRTLIAEAQVVFQKLGVDWKQE